jgi:hypothetical protein
VTVPSNRPVLCWFTAPGLTGQAGNDVIGPLAIQGESVFSQPDSSDVSLSASSFVERGPSNLKGVLHDEVPDDE